MDLVKFWKDKYTESVVSETQWYEAYNSKCQEMITLKEAIAPILGFSEYSIPFNSSQKVWAKSQDQANTLQLGHSFFKFVDAEIKERTKHATDR